MDDLLINLEHRIKNLITKQMKAHESQASLQLEKETLEYQNEALLTKQQKVVSHIEGLIGRLKALEKSS